jgi:ABC-type sugar transport system permease subunit
VFDLVYPLTGGSPADSTETLSTLSYKVFFSTLRFGYGSTLTIAMFITEGVIALGFYMCIVQRLRKNAREGTGVSRVRLSFTWARWLF